MDLRRVILADLAVGIGAGRVEVAQRDRMDAVRALEVRQRALDGELRLAVAVDRLLRMRFRDRRLDRLAVGRARRREHEVRRPTRPPSPRARSARRRRCCGSSAPARAPIRRRRGTRRSASRRRRRARASAVAHRRHIGDVALDQLAVLARPRDGRRRVVEDDDAVAGAAAAPWRRGCRCSRRRR